MEEGKSSHEMSFRADMRDLIAVCWTKIDRKSKKVNFLINQNHTWDQKATAETIEDVGNQIESLQYKLDEISMFISTQVETEKVHYECKYFASLSHYPALNK